jgi:FixJ family two-component response regulator
MTQGTDNPIVFVIDDDASVLKALARLLRAAGFEALTFPSAEAFLEQHDPAASGCIVLDVAMPNLDGLALQQALAASGAARPIIFLTGQGTIPMSVQAMKAGAVDFLTKPVASEDLLTAVRTAFEKDRLARRMGAEMRSVAERMASLTSREREVLGLVVAGRLNKQIAWELGTVEKTVKVHRARVMQKMGVRSVAELVRITERAGVAQPESRLPR